jgi:hypothetical protein
MQLFNPFFRYFFIRSWELNDWICSNKLNLRSFSPAEACQFEFQNGPNPGHRTVLLHDLFPSRQLRMRRTNGVIFFPSLAFVRHFARVILGEPFVASLAAKSIRFARPGVSFTLGASGARSRWGVVQPVGHLTVNEDGEGSNPSAPASFPL